MNVNLDISILLGLLGGLALFLYGMQMRPRRATA